MTTLLVSTIILLALRLCIFAGLHIKYRDFNPLRNTVSDYGTGKSRRLYSIMGGLSLVAYASLCTYLALSNTTPLWLTYTLGLAVLGSVAILFFPTDRTGQKATRSGKIHLPLAIFNFTALFVFMTNTYTFIPDITTQPEILIAATWMVRVTFYAFLMTLVLPKLRQKYVGLTERLFLTATPLWFILFSWLLLG